MRRQLSTGLAMLDSVFGRGRKLWNLLRSRRSEHVFGNGAGYFFPFYLFVCDTVDVVDLCNSAVLAIGSGLRLATNNISQQARFNP